MTEIVEWSWVNIVDAESSRAPSSTQNYKARTNPSTRPDVGQVDRLVPGFSVMSDASVPVNVSNLVGLYEERAAIHEFDGHYSRADAESLAWGEVLNRWHMRHGERVPRGLCAGCRQPIGSSKALDMIDGKCASGGPRLSGSARRALARGCDACVVGVGFTITWAVNSSAQRPAGCRWPHADAFPLRSGAGRTGG